MINQENLQSFIKWTNLVGILSIVLGGLAALAGVAAFLIGAVPGVLMIIAGVKLLNAKKSAVELQGIEDPAIVAEKFNQLLADSTSFFKLQGIYYIVGIIMSVIGIIIWFAVVAAMLSQMQLY